MNKKSKFRPFTAWMLVYPTQRSLKGQQAWGTIYYKEKTAKEATTLRYERIKVEVRPV
jgi:hypothetical protein